MQYKITFSKLVYSKEPAALLQTILVKDKQVQVKASKDQKELSIDHSENIQAPKIEDVKVELKFEGDQKMEALLKVGEGEIDIDDKFGPGKLFYECQKIEATEEPVIKDED